MDDRAVGRENESRGLEVRLAFSRTSVAADGARHRERIQAIRDAEIEPELLHCAASFIGGIRRKCHDTGVVFVELGVVLLEISQLLTTVASPVPAIEDEHCSGAVQVVWHTQRVAADEGRLELGEPISNLESVHHHGLPWV